MDQVTIVGIVTVGGGALLSLLVAFYSFFKNNFDKPLNIFSAQIKELTIELRHQNEIQSKTNEQQQKHLDRLSEDFVQINGRVMDIETFLDLNKDRSFLKDRR